MLEEKRQIDRFENLRINGIRNYFETVRNELQILHKTQTQEIKARWDKVLANAEIELSEAKTKRYQLQQARSEQRSLEQVLKERHASQACEDFRRQFKAQADLLASMVTSDSDMNNPVNNSVNALRINDLLTTQANERQSRDKRFRNELDDTRKQYNLAHTEKGSDQSFLEADSALADAYDQLEKTREMVASEKRWIELAATERLAIVNEDEVRYIESGREAPQDFQLPDIESEPEVGWRLPESSSMGARREALEASHRVSVPNFSWRARAS